MGIGIDGPIRMTSNTRPDDPVAAAKRYNASLPRVGIVVLRPFNWENRVTVPGEELSVPVCDQRDLCFRRLARKA